jgi:hypothetical protein
VTCKVAKLKKSKIKVTCTVKFAKAATAVASVQLVRGGKVLARGRLAAGSKTAKLHPRTAPSTGAYRVVVVSGASRTSTRIVVG